MATLSIVDFILFGLSLALSASVGLYHAWKSKKLAKQDREASKTLEYLMGGRKMPIFPVALSVMSTFLSGVSLLGVPAEVYQRGLLFWLYYAVGALALMISGIFFMPIFYKLKPISIYEYFEHRFNSRLLRQLAAALFLVSNIFYMAVVIYAPAVALSGVTQVSIWPFIISVGIVCTFYTTIGGLKAVVWTDSLQAAFIYAGVLILIIKGTIDSGGVQQVYDIALKSRRIAPLANIDPDPLQYMSIWITIFGGISFWLSAYGLNQMAVQRYCSLPTIRHMAYVISITAPAYIFIGSLCCLIGVVMLAYFYNCDPLLTGEAKEQDQLVILFATKVLGTVPGLPGLFLACLFSGTLSTVSSGINSMAAVTWEDFLKQPLSRRHNSDTYSTIANKIMVCIFGALAVCLSFACGPMGGLIKAVITVLGTLAGPLIGLFFLGVFFPGANKHGALVGALVSTLVSSWICIGNVMSKPFSGYSLPLNNTCSAIADKITWVNVSEFYNPDMHYGREDVFPIFRISAYLFPLIGIILVLTVGVTVSYIWPVRQLCPAQFLEDDLDKFTFQEEKKFSPESLTFFGGKFKEKVGRHDASPFVHFVHCEK